MRKLPVSFAVPFLALLLNAVVGGTAAAASSSQQQQQQYAVHRIPVIDLSTSDEEQLTQDIADACSTYGFFQVQNHGISPDLIERFREQCRVYFDLPHDLKNSWKRHGRNARGFFDDELTKQRRDWKECLDVGVPGSRDWNIPDDSDLNGEPFLR